MFTYTFTNRLWINQSMTAIVNYKTLQYKQNIFVYLTCTTSYLIYFMVDN